MSTTSISFTLQRTFDRLYLTQEQRRFMGAIHSTKIFGNFGPKLNGSVRSNRKSFEKNKRWTTFSRSDRLEFWLNGSRPIYARVPVRSVTVNLHLLVIEYSSFD